MDDKDLKMMVGILLYFLFFSYVRDDRDSLLASVGFYDQEGK